jgi:hypothetical protein
MLIMRSRVKMLQYDVDLAHKRIAALEKRVSRCERAEGIADDALLVTTRRKPGNGG